MIVDSKRLESSSRVSSVERRNHPRYPFSATAEVVEIGSGARIQGRISDLGRGGCYIDSMSPLGVSSEVKIRIVDKSRMFVAQGKVVFASAGMGMGLMFTAIEPEQLLVLERWLAELSGEAAPEPLVVEDESLPPASSGRQSAEPGAKLRAERTNYRAHAEKCAQRRGRQGAAAEVAAMKPMAGRWSMMQSTDSTGRRRSRNGHPDDVNRRRGPRDGVAEVRDSGQRAGTSLRRSDAISLLCLQDAHRIDLLSR